MYLPFIPEAQFFARFHINMNSGILSSVLNLCINLHLILWFSVNILANICFILPACDCNTQLTDYSFWTYSFSLNSSLTQKLSRQIFPGISKPRKVSSPYIVCLTLLLKARNKGQKQRRQTLGSKFPGLAKTGSADAYRKSLTVVHSYF